MHMADPCACTHTLSGHTRRGTLHTHHTYTHTVQPGSTQPAACSHTLCWHTLPAHLSHIHGDTNLGPRTSHHRYQGGPHGYPGEEGVRKVIGALLPGLARTPNPGSPLLPPPTSTKWSGLTTGRGVLVCVHTHTNTHTLVSTSVKATHCHLHNHPARLRPGSSPEETQGWKHTSTCDTQTHNTHTVMPSPG